jgi:hypothetical protein
VAWYSPSYYGSHMSATRLAYTCCCFLWLLPVVAYSSLPAYDVRQFRRPRQPGTESSPWCGTAPRSHASAYECACSCFFFPCSLTPPYIASSIHQAPGLSPHRGVVLLPVVIRQLVSCRHLVISEDGRVVQQLAPAAEQVVVWYKL